eukprot:658405-Amphidinium_carterae.2
MLDEAGKSAWLSANFLNSSVTKLRSMMVQKYFSQCTLYESNRTAQSNRYAHQQFEVSHEIDIRDSMKMGEQVHM